MYEIINDFLKSKNPFIVTVALVVILCALVVSAFAITARVNAFADRYETKEEHKQDIEAQVELFRKDVRIAILENNKVLLDEMEKRLRK